jgi:branched-chain amino acid transport system substrate-binding protein
LEVVEGCANLHDVKHLAGFKTVVKLEHVMTKISTPVLRIACLVSACGVLSWNAVLSAADSDQISIGAVLPLSGDAAHWGIPARTGAEMAVEEINHADGIGGRSLALVVEDDRCSPADGVSAFNTIMASAKPPVAVLGAVCSGVTLALAPLAESRKVVLISPASTSPKLTGAGDFIFRVVPSGSVRGQVFAEYLYRDRGLRKLAVLYINNEGGIGGSTAFKARFTQLGGTVAIELPYAQGTTDLRAQLDEIKTANTEGVLIGSYPPDTVAVLQQAREIHLQQPLFFTTEAVQNPEVLRQAGDAAEGATYILAAPAAGEAVEKFTAAYEAKFGKEPELFAAEGYDVIRLIAEAIAGTTAESLSGSGIRDFLRRVRDYAGASGTISFDQNGDVIKPYAIKRIEGGNPKTILVR